IAEIAQQDLTEQTDNSPLTATIPVTFTDVDLTDTGHTADITGVVASGTTSGLALDNAALIDLVTPGTVAKEAGSSSGSVNLSFSAASTAFDYLAAGEQLTLTYTVAIDDGHGGVTPQTFVVTVTGTNDAPVFTGADLAPTYQAGEAAVALAGSVSASDVDSSNYAGGSFTAAVTDGGHQGDTLTIANGDLISVSGTDILYDADGAAGPGSAHVIGTLSDYDTNGLKVTLNGSANDAAVAALAQAIEFSNLTRDPVAGERTVTFTLQDGGGTANGAQDSAYFTTKVDVEAAANPAAPVLSAESISVVENNDTALTTTVFGIQLSDDDQDSDVTITASAVHGTLSSVQAGTVSEINTQFANGIIYTPTGYNGDTHQNDIVTVTATDVNGHSDTLNFVFQQSGWDGATLEGTNGKDVIFATEGNDTLTGNAKADQFVFAPARQYDDPSADKITDFKPGEDHIDLRAFSEVDSSNIETWLSAHAKASPTDDGDTLITLTHGETITLKGVAVASLHASDFIVSPHH
ncbi:VCBS domain-containing protein, partial [Bradyrhizobium lablabi]|uniref:VCBS domain-containing protein n=1 Tax=Bradyrhizobium lablabi TaxID=722472 RepID=UPI0018F8C972